MRNLMGSITGLSFWPLFVGYGAAWYFGAWSKATSRCLLFMATVVTGIYWVAERFYFLPQRRQGCSAKLDQNAAVRRQDGALQQWASPRSMTTAA